MTVANRSSKELLAEIEELRFRLDEAEQTLRAIGSGEVDAFVVSGPQGNQVFTLKGAEHPYRVLVETMTEGAATLAADGTILYCNNRLAAMLKVPLENLIGTQLGSHLASADRPLYKATLKKCTERSVMDEMTLITQTGDLVPVLTSFRTIDISGDRGISVVITDLTQQKRTEEIMSSEMLARSVIEQAGEAIVVCDGEGVVIRASQAAHELCGNNPLLAPFDQLFRLRKSDTEDYFSVWSALHGESFGNAEVEFQRGDGKVFHLIINATALAIGQKRRVGCVVTLTDITERVQTEEALRTAHGRINAILEQMSDGFAAFDRDWRYTYVNRAAAKAFHLNPEHVLGKSIWEVWPAYAPSLDEKFRRSLEENLPIQFEAHYPPLDRWFECRCHPTPEGLATFFSDITERKHSEEMLKESNLELENRVAQRTAELREKDQMLLLQSRHAAMGEMIGNIAHQWRQPLNVLGLTVQQLLLYYDIDEFDRTFLVENVDKAMELIHHMSQTIDDFRNFFKPEKEKVKFNVLESITQTMSLLDGQNADVEVIAKDDPEIVGYPNEFAQVVLNIVVNAKDALTERGIDNPEITVTISNEDGCATVTVADNAGGIPEEIIDRIFEPYFTTKGPHNGTGVGLFMSKVIIEKNMGGRLSVRNKEKGAEFRIEVCHERNS